MFDDDMFTGSDVRDSCVYCIKNLWTLLARMQTTFYNKNALC